MITIFKKKPKQIELISFNDVYFNRHTFNLLDEYAKQIIMQIDHSEMVNKYQIKSRFDNLALNIDKLSTGCKTVLNILYNPDKCFDIRECGNNALDVIYSLPQGNVYCDYPWISFDMKQVSVFGEKGIKIIDTYESLKEWWLDKD